MRIVGGRNKGRHIKVSKRGIRPTKGIVREAIFNIIGNTINHATVLDIFAGSGAFGLEALSRGAQTCVFIEKRPKILVENMQKLSCPNETQIITGDFRAALKKVKDRQFDIIFLDPPYNRKYVETTIKLIVRYALLAEHGTVIAEHSPAESFSLPEHLFTVKQKRYGETMVTFLAFGGKQYL